MESLEDLRKQIDSVDKKILLLVAARVKIVRKIGQLKHEQKLPILDTTRIKEALSTRKLFGKSLGIPEDITEKIYMLLHDLAIAIEKKQ